MAVVIVTTHLFSHDVACNYVNEQLGAESFEHLQYGPITYNVHVYVYEDVYCDCIIIRMFICNEELVRSMR